jgi:hypothetical protein
LAEPSQDPSPQAPPLAQSCGVAYVVTRPRSAHGAGHLTGLFNDSFHAANGTKVADAALLLVMHIAAVGLRDVQQQIEAVSRQG